MQSRRVRWTAGMWQRWPSYGHPKYFPPMVRCPLSSRSINRTGITATKYWPMLNSCKLIDVLDSVLPMPDYRICHAASNGNTVTFSAFVFVVDWVVPMRVHGPRTEKGKQRRERKKMVEWKIGWVERISPGTKIKRICNRSGWRCGLWKCTRHIWNTRSVCGVYMNMCTDHIDTWGEHKSSSRAYRNFRSH